MNDLRCIFKKKFLSSISEPTKLKLVVLLLLVSTVFSYHNGLFGEFLLDDEPQISQNANIRQLWPPDKIFANNRRPILYLSLAVNYAVGGQNTFGYHLFNVAIHFLSALLLFGIIRRTTEKMPSLKNYLGLSPFAFALTVSMLWLVHPMQTESVTYVVQRTESLAGLFYLLTIYAVARRIITPAGGWSALAVLACALGMATKETVVTAPFVAICYDRIFFSRSWKILWQKRKALHLGLASTWLIVVFLLITTHPEKDPSAGFTYRGITPWQYFLTQAGVILHYLRLSVFPFPLVFDYADWPVAKNMLTVLPQLIGMVTLGGLTIGALRFSPSMGFLGLWFFVVLSPSSSFIPIADVAFEHRMYLALAAVITLGVMGGARLLRYFFSQDQERQRLAIGLVAVAAMIFSSLTVARNKDYQTEFSIWQDTVKKRPENHRAHALLGLALEQQGRRAEAAEHYKKAIALKPDDVAGYNNLGMLLIDEGKYAEAEYYFRRALTLGKKESGVLHNNLGLALANERKYEEAMEHYQKAMASGYFDPPVFGNMGIALVRTGRVKEAVSYFQKALVIDPNYQEAQIWLMALEKKGVVP